MSSSPTVTTVLELIADDQLAADQSGSVSEVLLAAAFETLDLIDPDARVALARGFVAVAARAIEFQLLSDPVLQNFVRIWPSIGGRERELVAERLSDVLGRAPPERLVLCLVARLSAASDTLRNRGGAYHLEDVVARLVSDGATELRCYNCGYHFREDDFEGRARRDFVRESGIRLAIGYESARLNDPLKPTHHKGKSLTEATVDHVVPLSAFGTHDPSNLRVLCLFCNYGKAIYRRAFEAISPSVAGASQTWNDAASHALPKQMTMSFILWHTRTCATCGNSTLRTELTARPRGKSTARVEPMFMLPWTLVQVCYPCLTVKASASLP